jgi:3-oxoacyl-[acyl-carrier protein] reductase
VAAIGAAGGQALALRADLTDPAATGEMLSRVKAAWDRIDVLVLNASGGIAVAAAATAPHPTGHTVYVGGRDYLAGAE